jgi:4-amino-4-deoxy-L-arabinose transferase-like glycosyltransferase
MGISLLAFWLRARGLFANSFHADEALFASWARHIASWKDPLLLAQPVDKPPLLFYIQALFYLPSGPVEWAARLPNFMVSVWLVPLTAVLYRHLYLTQRRRDAEDGRHQTLRASLCLSRSPWRSARINLLIPALIVACSPLAIQFSATAFTDPLLTFWLITSLSAIRIPYSVNRPPLTAHRSPLTAHCSPLTSGLLFGLAVATKYQAVLFLPLVMGLGWLMSYGRAQWQRWLMGVLPVLTAVFLWDVARTGSWSLWSAQIGNYGGVRLAWSWELWPRLLAWGRLWSTAVPPLLLFGLLVLLVGLAWRAFRVDDAASRVDLLLVLFVLGYMVLHWLTAVPVWDRYLLPLLPIVAFLIGRGFSLILKIFADFLSDKQSLKSTFIRVHPRPILFLLLFLMLIFPAWAARYGRYPVGGQINADQGAAEIAAVLADEPYGTVLYDHWYSWQWGYHLFYRKVYVSWFPHSAALAEDLAVFGRDGHNRYVALPTGKISQPIIRTIHTAGFQLQPVAVAGNIALYQILPDEVTR